MRKDVEDVARRKRVCPPETRSVRKGNVGISEGEEVKRAVSACAC